MMFENDPVGFWFYFGILLMLCELILPGLIVVFLGIAALAVSLLIYIQFVDQVVMMMIAWMLVSVLLILLLRPMVARLVKGDETKENTDEDADAIGAIVKVLKPIKKGFYGRISYQGTSWLCESDDGEFNEGEEVRIVGRKGSVYVVASVAKGIN